MKATRPAHALPERRDLRPARTPTPLWSGRRGQFANLWLYVYCAILSPFILPLFYAAWRAVETFWHRYELLPDRLRITTGSYRPHIHNEEVDFEAVRSVRVEGFPAPTDREPRQCGARTQRRPQPGSDRGG